MNNLYPFDIAVLDYIASLNEDQKQRFRSNNFPVPVSEEGIRWYIDVIERYQLDDKTSPVSRDINERVYPDPDGLNGEWWDYDIRRGGAAMHEAITFLLAVSENLEK